MLKYGGGTIAHNLFRKSWGLNHSAGAITPYSFHRVLDLSIPEDFEPILGNGWSCNVSDKTFQSFSVAAVDDRIGMHVDPVVLSDDAFAG